MKHIVAIILKFIIVLVLLEITLSLLTALTVSHILIISLAVTLISYVIADLLIMGLSNNTVATSCEAILTFLTIYFLSYWMGYGFIAIGPILVSTAVLAFAQWFFHKYTLNAIYPSRRKQYHHHA